ncbi:MAG: hypothetical protein ACREJX_18430, partial [Polyangiaceae bacterium]
GNDAVVALFGREAVEDAEMRIAAGENKNRLDGVVEALGLAYKISTRLTSWVAIDPSVSVDPRDPSRRANVPQALAHGLSAEGLGLRNAMSAAPPMAYGSPMQATLNAPAFRRSVSGPLPALGRARVVGQRAPAPAPQSPAPLARPMPKKEEAPQERADPSTDRHKLRGRIVLAKNGELLIEIILTHEIDWLTDSVRFVMNDNRTAPAIVDAQKSTRSGLISAGSAIRLVLSLGSFTPDDIVALEVVLADGPVLVEIDR